VCKTALCWHQANRQNVTPWTKVAEKFAQRIGTRVAAAAAAAVAMAAAAMAAGTAGCAAQFRMLRSHLLCKSACAMATEHAQYELNVRKPSSVWVAATNRGFKQQ